MIEDGILKVCIKKKHHKGRKKCQTIKIQVTTYKAKNYI